MKKDYPSTKLVAVLCTTTNHINLISTGKSKQEGLLQPGHITSSKNFKTPFFIDISNFC